MTRIASLPVEQWDPELRQLAQAATLPEVQQKALLAAAATAEKRGWEMSRQREKESNEILAKNGITLHQPDAKMMAEFQRVGRIVADEWLKKAGAEGQAILKGLRGK